MSSGGWVPIFGVTPSPTKRVGVTGWPPKLKPKPGWTDIHWMQATYPTTTTTELEATTSDGAGVEDFDPGDVAFILVASALVLLMIPGLGFYYSGLTRVTSALSLILICFWSLALVSVQWFVIGYSLTFSDGGSRLIGDFQHLFLAGVHPAAPAPHLPGLLFVLYQLMFAAITPALIFGGAAERFRFLPATVFIPIWTTLVYDPIAYWTWNPNGWGAVLGGLDFAGGTPVHISSGAAALAYALVLGKRQRKLNSDSHNISYVLLGTALLWFGWFGFNGGSALAASSQAVAATLATHLAACAGGVTGLMINYAVKGTYSALGFCSGAVAGLVSITPAAGFVSPASSLLFGCVGSIACYVGVKLVQSCRCDDALEVFGVHGIGGIVGNLLTGVFAEKRLGAQDGGGLDGNWSQCISQLVDSVVGFSWSFVVTLLLLLLLNILPGMKLRMSEGAERVGPDLAEHGERCYEWAEKRRVWHTQTQLSSCPAVTTYRARYEPGRQFDYEAQLNQTQKSKGTQYEPNDDV